MGWPWKEAEKKAKDAVNGVINKVLKPAVRDAERKAGSLTSGIERKGKAVINTVDAKLDDLAEDAINSVKDAVDEVEDKFTEDIPALVAKGLDAIKQEASERAMQEALDTFLDVVETIAPTRASMTFGMALSLIVEGEVGCTITVPNPVAKLTEIRKWANDPPKGRAQIIDCIKDFGPESISAGFKVCGNGPDFEWEGSDKYDRIDAFLEKHGVE